MSVDIRYRYTQLRIDLYICHNLKTPIVHTGAGKWLPFVGYEKQRSTMSVGWKVMIYHYLKCGRGSRRSQAAPTRLVLIKVHQKDDVSSREPWRLPRDYDAMIAFQTLSRNFRLGAKRGWMYHLGSVSYLLQYQEEVQLYRPYRITIRRYMTYDGDFLGNLKSIL